MKVLVASRRDQRSAEAAAYRKLYSSARWRKLREWVLNAEPLCRYCMESETIEPATVVDHVRPHKGDPLLFWDPNNLQPLCAACHDGRKQSEERGTAYIAFDASGWPL